MPIAATPLRHVLSKSIQRAIREHGVASPTSPLDLRLSPVIRRTNSDPVSSRTSTRIDLLQLQPKSVQRGRLNFLATVYESAKNFQEIRSGNVAVVFETIDSIENASETEDKPQEKIATCDETSESFACPKGASTSVEEFIDSNDEDGAFHETWHTPKEYPSINYSAEDYQVK